MMKFEDLVDMYVYGTCMAVETSLSMPRVVVVSQSLPKYSVPQVRLCMVIRWMPQQVRSVRGLGRQCYSRTVPRLELSYVPGTRSQVWAYGGHTNLSWPLEDLHLAYKEAFQQHAAVGVMVLRLSAFSSSPPQTLPLAVISIFRFLSLVRRRNRTYKAPLALHHLVDCR